jgi:hypothetical protein
MKWTHAASGCGKDADCKPRMVLTLVLHSCQQLGLVDEALYYLGDDKGGVDRDCNSKGQVVGESAMQLGWEQHPQGTGGDRGGRITNG